MVWVTDMEQDPAIQKVVDHGEGPLLVLGGPGTGKTTALERRYLRLAQEEGLAPHRILLLCLTRWYSMEAKDRLIWALPVPAAIEIPVYTWHALAFHLVSRYYPSLGYREPPVLLTGPEQWGIVRELLHAEDRGNWPVWGERLRERGFVDEVADFCLRVEQRMMSAEDLQALGTHRPDWAEVIRFYDRYRQYLKDESRLDYAALIAASVRLLESAPDVRDALRRRFPHVLVDDAQELSAAQRNLLFQLETKNLVVASDPDSGIEQFRGADPDWTYGFTKQFPEAEKIVLDSTYRLGEEGLQRTSELIRINDTDADHRPSRAAPHPTKLESRIYTSVAEEVEGIARELRHLHLVDAVPWAEMAVLISQPSYLLAPLERALERWEVPFRPLSGDRPLASEPSIACFLDLVRVALKHPGWDDILPTLLTGPLVGLGFSRRRILERTAWQEGTTLADLVERDEDLEEFRGLRQLVIDRQSQADECFWQVWSASSYYQEMSRRASANPGDPSNAELDAAVAFSHALGRFVERRHGRGSIQDFLSEAARADFGGDPWLPASTSGRDGVSLLSFHASKGREWRVVFVCGCLDNWIPKGRRAQGLFDPFALEITDPVDREIEAIADDRRTFYVAATRAKERTVFTVSPGVSGRGRPTRFLSELGIAPTEFETYQELPPLTEAEFRARLRKTLASDAGDSEKVAALVALSEIPGADPSRWYGRWEWTEGAVPLAVPGEFRTSYSRLGVYDNCGLQYVLQSVLGLDPSSTESMKFGTWLHSLFEAVHQGRINDPQTLKAEYRRLFDERIFPNKAIAAQFRRDGEKMLEVFWTHEFKQDNVYTELDFLFPYGDAILRGRIDRIDKVGGALKLTDYKTAKWAVSQPEAAKSLQLAIYFLAVREAAGVEIPEGEREPTLTKLVKEVGGEPQVARLVFPGSTYPNGAPRSPSMNPEQADKVLEELPDLIRKVLDEKFSPTPEADCFFCRMKPLCPLWPEGREVQT